MGKNNLIIGGTLLVRFSLCVPPTFDLFECYVKDCCLRMSPYRCDIRALHPDLFTNLVIENCALIMLWRSFPNNHFVLNWLFSEIRLN